MMLRVSEDEMVPVSGPLTFGRWIDQGHELGFPTLDDLEYHLSTLFPPVRARGWLELRMIDSLPDPWWQVAVAVCAALFDDAEAAEEAARVTVPTAGLWADAACSGLAHPALGRAARACFAAALDALPRLEAGGELVDRVAAFSDRFVDRGRCPADELLDAAVLDRAEGVGGRTRVAASAETW
jgi:glutamate--cysteine ligase